jgi:chromosomal replication initiation ATPase DnaA
MFVAPKTSREKIAAAAREKLAAQYTLHPNRVTKRKLGFATAAIFATPFEAIAGKRRTETLQKPRRAFALIARDRLGQSYSEIARFLNRDHATVMHAYDRARRLRIDDPDFAAKCDAIESLLWGAEDRGQRTEDKNPSPVRERGRGEGFQPSD